MECKEDEFISVMRVNLFASYWMLKEFLPGMLSRNHGHIVSIVGSAGLFGFCHMFDNCTSKFALIGMMKRLFRRLECDLGALFYFLLCPLICLTNRINCNLMEKSLVGKVT